MPMRLLAITATICLSSVIGDRRPMRPVLLLRGGADSESSTSAPDDKIFVRTYSGRASSFDVFRALEDEGQRRTFETCSKLLAKSVTAGVFVGFGGTLCAGIGGDLSAVPFWAPGQGLARFVFGAIGFPLSITLVSLTGASAFTGNLALCGAALRAKKVTVKGVLKLLATTYLGCFIGTVLVGMLTGFASLPAAKPCIAIALHKLELTSLQTFLRGIGGGTLIALAITMATSAVRNEGGTIDIFCGIWLAIMTYVACDFEHCLANMYFFAAAVAMDGKLSGTEMLRNILFSTMGNIIGAGALGGWALTAANGPDKTVGEVYPKSAILDDKTDIFTHLDTAVAAP